MLRYSLVSSKWFPALSVVLLERNAHLAEYSASPMLSESVNVQCFRRSLVSGRGATSTGTGPPLDNGGADCACCPIPFKFVSRPLGITSVVANLVGKCLTSRLVAPAIKG